MHFEYTAQKAVLAGELDFASTAALSLNGGLIRDYALANATPTLPAPGAAGSLGFFADFVIDGVRPTVTFIAPAAPAGPTAVRSDLCCRFFRTGPERHER